MSSFKLKNFNTIEFFPKQKSSNGNQKSNNSVQPTESVSSTSTSTLDYKPSAARLNPLAQNQRKANTKSVYYQSKFKYINGKSAHKSEHITNIRNLSAMWPSECNGFQVNRKRAAFMLAGMSGQIGIVELDKPGRLPDTSVNSLINKSKVSDFQWDPFNEETLACGCDDGVVKIWRVGETGLETSLEEPFIELKGN